MPEKYIRRDGLPLLIRHAGPTTRPEVPPIRGQGPPILCLHDSGLQSALLGDLLRALGASNAVSFDFPGHGRSGGLEALPSIEAMAEMAIWIAQWCQLDRPILVGHGMGALVALEWARSRDQSEKAALGGLVLCGVGNAMGIEDEAIETMRRVTRGKAPRPFDPGCVAKGADPELMKRAYIEGLKTDPRATVVDLEASQRWCQAFDDPSAISLPTRVIAGSADRDPCRERANSLAESLGSGTYLEIQGAAHHLPLEKPTELAHQIHSLCEAA